MKTIAIFNNKGGVGKTTFLCNLASFLSLKKQKKVLIVDADPQCNATIYLLPENQVVEIYVNKKHQTIDSFVDPLRQGAGYLAKRSSPVRSPRFEVDLVPGDPKLALSEDLLASDWKSGVSGDPRGLQTSFVFQDLVYKYQDYDLIFFDVGPSLGAINRSVLIASDFFVMPMSSDIFSLMAISNISLSLAKWKSSLYSGLEAYKKEESRSFSINGHPAGWHLQFLGYVTQQYTAKRVQRRRQPVKAYDRILRKAPALITRELVEKFSELPSDTDFKIGEIPNLHSVVPLSQTANAPIFELKARDGVVGAHFTKVSDAEKIYREIAQHVLRNVGG